MNSQETKCNEDGFVNFGIDVGRGDSVSLLTIMVDGNVIYFGPEIKPAEIQELLDKNNGNKGA